MIKIEFTGKVTRAYVRSKSVFEPAVWVKLFRAELVYDDYLGKDFLEFEDEQDATAFKLRFDL